MSAQPKAERRWRALGAYGELLGTSGVRRVIASAGLSRLATAMLALALLLAVVEAAGYAVAGAALAAQGVALAVLSPVGGRLVDRHGPRRVLAAYVPAHALAYAAAITVLIAGAAAPLLLVAAGLLGATAPPAAAATRAAWPALVDADTLHSAYALDTALNSLTFIVGPLVVAAGVALAAPVVMVAAAAACRLAGDLGLLATSPTAAPARRTSRRAITPALRWPLALLLALAALDTFTYGALQVGALAGSSSHRAPLLLSVLAAGETVGGLVYGARAAVRPLGARLSRLHLATSVPLAAFGLAPPVAVMLAVYLVAGLLSGARDALTQLAVQAAAAAGGVAEAFSWLSTLMWGGYALGTLTAGQLQAAWGVGAIAAAAVIAALVAAAIAGYASRQSALAAPLT